MNTYNRAFYPITFKVLRKLHLVTFIFKTYKMLNGGGHCQTLINILNTIHQDVHSTCICKNNLETRFDLQIIVPVYNVEKYICACMDSIILQKTKYSFVVTVINDGSPDNSRSLLKRYEKYPNVEIIDQENQGLSGARNTGLKHIRGRYVTFVDSDDLLQEGAIEHWMDAALKYDADIVEGGYSCFNDKQKGFDTFVHSEECSDRWYGRLYGFPWGKVFKARLFEHVQFPVGYWFEDTVCSFILYPMSKSIVTIPYEVYNYRINPKGITATSKGNPKTLDSLYITRSLLHDAKTLNIPLKGQLYDMFLSQLKMNYSRIATLKSSEVDKVVFTESVKMMDDYFTDCLTLRKDLRYVEEALRRKSYVLYMLSMNM